MMTHQQAAIAIRDAYLASPEFWVDDAYMFPCKKDGQHVVYVRCGLMVFYVHSVDEIADVTRKLMMCSKAWAGEIPF